MGKREMQNDCARGFGHCGVVRGLAPKSTVIRGDAVTGGGRKDGWSSRDERTDGWTKSGRKREEISLAQR